MRFYIYSKSGEGSVLAWRLKQEGYEVVLNIEDPWMRRNLEGIVEHSNRKPRRGDVVIFDSVGMSEIAEELRDEGFKVIGGSVYGDRLENDRAFGMQEFREVGLEIPRTEECGSISEAIKLVSTEGGRWVFKPSENQDCACTYCARDEMDMMKMLEHFQGMLGDGVESIMQEFVEGVCLSTEGWFDGEKWLEGRFNSTLEEKDLLVGECGPKTGCEWCGVWSVGEESRQVKEILEKFTHKLALDNYIGPFDLNCVIKDSKALVLEATPRFGYDAIAAFVGLWSEPLGQVLIDIVEGGESFYSVNKGEIGISSRISIPPYPFAKAEFPASGDIPIRWRYEDGSHLWLCGVRWDKKRNMITSAASDGTIGVVTASGREIYQACEEVKRINRNLIIPDLMWRDDIGSGIEGKLMELGNQGFEVFGFDFSSSSVQAAM